MELCLEHGRERKNLSVDRVADLMGLASRWTLYKWMESGRMPAVMIRPFEHATCATFVTQYLAASAHRLLVEIPAGGTANHDDLMDLQVALNDAVGLLTRFYRSDAEPGEVMQGVTEAMQRLAGHRVNVLKHEQPELDLDGEV